MGGGAAADLGMGDSGDQLSAQMTDEERERRKKLLQQGNADQTGGANAVSPAVMSLLGAFSG